MSLIQIPKIEYITLEQFIPNWTKVSLQLIFEGKKHHNELDLCSMNYCLVGEAHNFSRDYSHKCDECYNLAFDACDLVWCKNYERFENFKLDLFTHMLEAHPELMIK